MKTSEITHGWCDLCGMEAPLLPLYGERLCAQCHFETVEENRELKDEAESMGLQDICQAVADGLLPVGIYCLKGIRYAVSEDAAYLIQGT